MLLQAGEEALRSDPQEIAELEPLMWASLLHNSHYLPCRASQNDKKCT
jgi:hypothetical protein